MIELVQHCISVVLYYFNGWILFRLNISGLLGWLYDLIVDVLINRLVRQMIKERAWI
jgi:hypothetical protein